MRSIQLYLLVTVALLYVSDTSAQDTLRGNYNVLRLGTGVFYATGTVTVRDSLIIEPGTRLYFGSGVSLLAEGAVRMEGNIGSIIELLSIPGQSGQGLVIIGQHKGEVIIKNCSFRDLMLPLDFEYGWSRSRAEVANNEFVRNAGPVAVLQVLNAGNSLSGDTTLPAMLIHSNLFAENRSPVYIQDFMNEFVQLRIENNAFVNNRIQEYGKYTFSSNILFGRMDKLYRSNPPIINGNSFVNNYLWDNASDSMVHHANIGVYGSMDSVRISDNYFGGANESIRRQGIYDYLFNYTSPKLLIESNALFPSDRVPPHIYSSYRLPAREQQRASYRIRDGQWRLVVDSIGTDIDDFFDLSTGLQVLKLQANRKVDVSQIEVIYSFMSDSLKTVDTLLNCMVELERDKDILVQFGYRQDSMLRRHNGYLRIKGLTGENGEYVPELSIGYLHYLALYREAKALAELRKKRTELKDSVTQAKLKPELKLSQERYKKPYEIGFMAGYAVYYGTLSNRSLFKNDFNGGLGVEFRYAMKNNISVSLGVMQIKLTGSDLRSDDPLKIERGMAFVTPLTVISAQVEYNLYDTRYYYTQKRKLNASIGFGIDYVKFNPKGEYLGTLYDLQPMGTGGQTLPGATNKPYSLSSFGAPITVKLRYTINKKMVYTMFAGYHMTFTDYLDDVGADPYPDQVAIATVNTQYPEAAAYFSNPTKRIVSKGQLRSGTQGGSDGLLRLGFVLSYHF